MAIYHLSAKIFSRGNNHSAVAAAAYRSAEKLYDERQDKTLDYSRKQRVLHTEIIAPDIVPKWATEREALWNNVEAAEKRKDTQVAREVEVALPRELPPDAHQILIREFVQNEFISHGMIADVAIHESIAGDGATNPHAHIMLTTREITLEGFGKKNRDWNRKELMEAWRESWATHTNQYLKAIHSDQRIDHRSLEAQGITDRQPTQHMGKEATALERREQQTRRGHQARKIEHTNQLAKQKNKMQINQILQPHTPDEPISPKAWHNARKQKITYQKATHPPQKHGQIRSWVTQKTTSIIRAARHAKALARRALNTKKSLIEKYTRRAEETSKNRENNRER